MRVVHEPADGGSDTDADNDGGTATDADGGTGTDPGRFRTSEERVLATDVEVADSFLTMLRGLMFRSSIPENYALVFPFDDAGTRSVHMLFVRFPIDVVWTVDDRVTQVSTLSSWVGLGWARGDRFVELPAGAAEGVEPGDVVRIDEA